MNKLLKALLTKIGVIYTVEIPLYNNAPQNNNQPQPRKPLLNFIKRAGKFFIYTDTAGKQRRCNTLIQAMEYACIYSRNFSADIDKNSRLYFAGLITLNEATTNIKRG